MKYTLKDIATIVGGDFSGDACEIDHIVTDSRTVINPSSALFVAIHGSVHNGHSYISNLYEAGVRGFIVDSAVDTSKYPKAGFVHTDNSVSALQSLASHHRGTFKGIVVAITGSNGKTVTKEWIAQLSPIDMKIFRSPKSYNSQIGVALSLLMLRGDEQMAVIEAGISLPGEMQRLADMIRPDIAILTNIGDAHQLNFQSIEQKINEKIKLFDSAKIILFNDNDIRVSEAILSRYPDRDLRAVRVGQYDISALNFVDLASKENVTQALALLDAIRVDMTRVLSKLSTLQSVAMRLELKDGISGCKIINDSYNSDINSLAIALDYQCNVAGGRAKVLIISDIFQSGMNSAELYAEVARLVNERSVDKLFGVGSEIFRYCDLFSCEKEFFLSTDNLLKSIDKSEFINKCVLIKGSRPFSFERISRCLESRTHTTTLEVNLDRMAGNLNYYRSMLGEGVRTMAMVKALGYGSGSYEVASALQHQGVDYLAVAFADEGVTLRDAGITMPIVVLNADSDSFEVMLDHQLEPEIYSFNSLKAFVSAAERRGDEKFPIHIKLDTGMHRLGFEKDDIGKLISLLVAQNSLYVSTVFSHLAASEDPAHDDFTRSQIALFKEFSDQIIEAFPDWKILRHICNSAGIERFKEAHFDIVRLGIGLYGLGLEGDTALKPVSTLRSRIVQIKRISPPDTVGYGRHGKVSKDIVTATIPIGYADGLDRHLGRGVWSVLVNGQKAPIIGNICMDTCMIDITGIKAFEGDEVVIFGDGVTVEQMAKMLDTITYEILTNISARVKRVYIKE